MISTRSATPTPVRPERDDPELLAGRAGGSAEPLQHRDDAGQKHQRDQDDAAAENHLDVRPGIDRVPAAVDAVPTDKDEPDEVQPHPCPRHPGDPAPPVRQVRAPGDQQEDAGQERQRHRPSEGGGDPAGELPLRRGAVAVVLQHPDPVGLRGERDARRQPDEVQDPADRVPRMCGQDDRAEDGAAEAREVDERPAVDAGRLHREGRVRRRDQRRVDDGQHQADPRRGPRDVSRLHVRPPGPR